MKIKSIRLIIGLFIIVILVVSSDVRAVDEPLVNPLNNLDAYQDYEYESSEEEYFEYVDEEGNRQVYFLKGDYWSYTVTDITDREKAVEDFITYINNLSANIIFQSTEQVIFNISTDATVTWWGEAVFEDDYYKIYLIKEWNLVPGETITRKLGGDLRFWSFNTKHTGEKLLSLNISLENGQFVVSDSVNMEIGGFSRRASYSRFMDGENYKLFYLDDIPQETGEHYWTIRDDYLDEVYEVSVTLEEVADLPPVKYGEEIGALRVRGVNFGRVSVEAASEASVNHPLFDYDISDRGDLTAEGDTIFWLPAGHWKVRIIPEDFATLEYCETQLVPVNAGELTILDVPKSLNSSFAEVSGDGLVINKTRELDNHGLITISYSEENTNEILPNLDNTEVYEGGKQAVIKNIQSVADIGNIVLLLDSSGSMRGQMEETLATARNFIQSLPDNINIQVIDFDNEPRLLNGNSKEEVLTKLDIVKADGATALYDSVLEGLAYLSGKDCPNLLLFTDGVDANWDDSGPGSVATKGEVLSAVEESGVPLYTIGFGPGHDDSTLKDLADISDGIYYPADNQTALAEVFTAINASLSQSYQITYNRPDSPALSDTPVVSMVIDTSSSMNMSPETNGCNYRIETVRKLIRNFILNLPEKSLAQLQSFNDDTYMNQIMTDNRALLLHALGGLRTKDGTDILGSVKVAVESLKNVSSSRKILLYITDAALAVDEGEKEVFDDLLVKIKEEDIRVIWVGLGITEEEEAFAHAAELSGGEYLITEDFSLLENKFNDLIQKMSEPSTVKRVPLRVVINEISESGEVKQFADNTLVDFTVTEVNDTVEYPDIVVCQTGLPFDKYNREVHNAVSQEAIPEKEVIVSKRVPLNVTASNQAMEIMVKEAIFLNKLNGIEIPFNKRLIILNMELNNILPEQEVIIYPDGSSHPSSWLNSPVDGERVVMRIPYLINDITSHLFLNYNNSMMYPVSPLTWITEKPIVRPGENSIQIEPEENISGICAFLIDKEAMDQASLHFYDTNYGHISLPLVGEIKQQELALEELPTGTPAVISDSFSLTLTGASDLKEIQTIEVENENVFRVVEGNFTSRVQALLDINPNKHFHLRLSTGKGDLYIPLNPITALLPYGLNGAVTLAPGSINKARFAFQVPEYLAEDYSAELFIELAGRDVILPIGDIPDATDISDTSSQLMEGDGIKLQVNQLAYYDDMVVADLTLFDSKDGDSTLLDNDAFILVRDDYFGEESVQKTAGEVAEHKGLGGFSNNTRETEYIIRPLEYTEKLLFAGNMPVFDGTNRRVLLLYEIPSDGEEHNWTLQSEYFSELNYEISENEFTEPELLVEKMVPGEESDASFQQKSSEAIYSAIKDYQLSKTLDSQDISTRRLTLEEDEVIKESVPTPMMTMSARQQFSEIDTLDEFIKIMKEVRWLPTVDSRWQYRYAPEAVLSQGWGTGNDLAHMLEIILLRMGYIPERRIVELTDQGYEELLTLGQIEKVDRYDLPALSYIDEEGTEHLIVIPFMKDISQLEGLVEVSEYDDEIEKTTKEARITVSLKVIPLQVDRNSQLRDMGSALAGDVNGVEVEEIELIGCYVDLDNLSRDAIDLAYIPAGREVGDLYTVLIETADRKIIGYDTVDTGIYQIVGEKIKLEVPYDELIYEQEFTDQDSIDGLFHTLGLNLPDIREDTAVQLESQGQRIYNTAENPDELSALRWYTRSVIGRFLTAQSKYEQELADLLGLTIGRTINGRCLIVTVKADLEGNFRSSIDLLQIQNDIHTGSKEAISTFNIFSGLYASVLEAEVLSAEEIEGMEKLGLLEIWQQVPEDTHFVSITGDNRDEIVRYMEENQFPQNMIKRIAETYNAVLIPSKPSLINDKERWAWLEIDPYNYRTIAVLDNGKHGAMMEHVLGNWQQEGLNFYVGGFIGVDASIWSVSAFSLKLANYQEIKSQAEQFAKGLADNFTANLASAQTTIDGTDFKIEIGAGIGGTPSIGGTIGPITGSFDLISCKAAASQNLLGYGNGFKAAVELYFRFME